MSVQNVSAIVGNKKMARSFTDSSTDGVWDGNLLLSQNSSQNIGLEMSGVMVDFVQVQYTAGCLLWRFRDSVSNAIMRWGFGSKVSYVCGKETYITPFKILPTTLFEVYPMALAAGANDTACLGWISTGANAQPYGVTTTSDNTLTAVTNLITGQSVGSDLFGKTITKIEFQTEDGSSLVSLNYQQSDGANQWMATGNVRSPSAGSTSTIYNIYADVQILAGKGDNLQISVTSA
jgi:hypothetical protein